METTKPVIKRFSYFTWYTTDSVTRQNKTVMRGGFRTFLRRGCTFKNDVTDRRGKQTLKANAKKASSQGEGRCH